MLQLRIIYFVALIYFSHCQPRSPVFPVGFSYTRFSGPVSGPEKQIVFHDPNDYGHPHVDYIAKPDYQFSYGVDDPRSRVQQNRKEVRHGDTVHGEYSVIDPDGSHRLVQYTADDINGFQARVLINGQLNSYHFNDGSQTKPVHENSPAVVETPPTESAQVYQRPREHEQQQVHEEQNEQAPRSIEHSAETIEETDHGHQNLRDEERSNSYESNESDY